MKIARTTSGHGNSYPVFSTFRQALLHYDDYKPTIIEGKISASPFLFKKPPCQADFRAHGKFTAGEVTMEHLANGNWGGSFGIKNAVMPAFNSVCVHNHPFNDSRRPFLDLLFSLPSHTGKGEGDLSNIYYSKTAVVVGTLGIVRLLWSEIKYPAEIENALRVFVMMKNGNINILNICWDTLIDKIRTSLELELQMKRLATKDPRQRSLSSEETESNPWRMGSEGLTFRTFLGAFNDSSIPLDIQHSFHVPKFLLYVIRIGTEEMHCYCELTFVAWIHFKYLFRSFNQDPGALLLPYATWKRIFGA